MDYQACNVVFMLQLNCARTESIGDVRYLCKSMPKVCPNWKLCIIHACSIRCWSGYQHPINSLGWANYIEKFTQLSYVGVLIERVNGRRVFVYECRRMNQSCISLHILSVYLLAVKHPLVLMQTVSWSLSKIVCCTSITVDTGVASATGSLVTGGARGL